MALSPCRWALQEALLPPCSKGSLLVSGYAVRADRCFVQEAHSPSVARGGGRQASGSAGSWDNCRGEACVMLQVAAAHSAEGLPGPWQPAKLACSLTSPPSVDENAPRAFTLETGRKCIRKSCPAGMTHLHLSRSGAAAPPGMPWTPWHVPAAPACPAACGRHWPGWHAPGPGMRCLAAPSAGMQAQASTRCQMLGQRMGVKWHVNNLLLRPPNQHHRLVGAT